MMKRSVNAKTFFQTSTLALALGASGLGTKAAHAVQINFSNEFGSASLDNPKLDPLFNNLSTLRTLNGADKAYLNSLKQGLDGPYHSSRTSTAGLAVPTVDVDTSQSPEDLLGQFFTLLALGTPGNDIISGEPGTDLQLARTGSDRLIGVNPGDAIPGQGQVDIMFGGPEFSRSGPSINTPKNNLFILGDWNKPYYAGGTGILGTGDFVLIADFKPANDVIRLNGTSDDYRLVNFNVPGRQESGSAVFRDGSTRDLIALLPGVSDLSLNQSYFEFVNTPPPNEIVSEVRQLGTSGLEQAFDVDSDSSGNVYVTGNTTGNLGDVNAGSKDAFIAKYDSAGNQVWLKQLGTEGTENNFGLKVDKNNNIYITGFTSGNLGGTNAGGDDAYVAKYDSDGNQVWAKQLGTPNLDTSFDIATDIFGNVYTTGYTSGDLGGPNQNSGQPVPITDDSYVSKFDSDGNLLWTRQFGTPLFDEAYGIATDIFGNVFATGWSDGNLGGTNAGLYDSWIAKILGDGTIDWIQQFGTEGYDFAWDTATDSFGNVYSVGFTTDSLGGTNAGLYDIFLAKYDTNGNQQWIEQLGTSGSEYAFGIDIDENNNIDITGFTTGALEGTNAGGDNAGADDAFRARFDIDGNLIEMEQFGTSKADRGFGIDNRFGRSIVAGFTDGSLGAPNKGSFDAFVTIKKGQPQSVPEPSGTLALIASAGLLLTKTIKKRSPDNVHTK